jgi:hypothetical protein
LPQDYLGSGLPCLRITLADKEVSGSQDRVFQVDGVDGGYSVLR